MAHHNHTEHTEFSSIRKRRANATCGKSEDFRTEIATKKTSMCTELAKMKRAEATNNEEQKSKRQCVICTHKHSTKHVLVIRSWPDSNYQLNDGMLSYGIIGTNLLLNVFE